MPTTRKVPEAVVFDMDGVLVDSARLHARAWKETFDEFLADRGRSDRFDLPDDYRRYVDGRPRYEGVASFLASRDIDLPVGDPAEPAGMASITGVGNLKNEVLHRLLESEDVERLDGVDELLDQLRHDETPIAVVSSSRNTDRILPGDIAERVDLVLGGRDLDGLGIPGKPAPDMFLTAVARFGLTAREAAVVEDAPAGVRAGRRGGFSLVVGVEPEPGTSSVSDLADIVVRGVSELPRHLVSWSDLLELPPAALENLSTIRRLINGSPTEEPSLYVGDDEDELLAVRQGDGVGVLVDSRPPAMTWADFSVPDPTMEAELRARLVDAEVQPAE
jgi:HAD superfamily hydrolase (TIGR01509 family)